MCYNKTNKAFYSRRTRLCHDYLCNVLENIILSISTELKTFPNVTTVGNDFKNKTHKMVFYKLIFVTRASKIWFIVLLNYILTFFLKMVMYTRYFS